MSAAPAEVVDAVSLTDFLAGSSSQSVASDLQSAVDIYDVVDVEPCLGQLRQLADSYPILPKAEIMLAALHYQTGHLQEARDSLELVAKNSSSDPSFLFTLAQINAAESKSVEAMVLIDRAMAITVQLPWSKDQKQSFANSCKKEKAALCETIGDWKQAAEMLEALINELEQAQLEQTQLEQTQPEQTQPEQTQPEQTQPEETQVQKAPSQKPRSEQSSFSVRLAKCYFKTDRVADAISELAKYSNDTDEIPELTIARWYADDGDSVKAEEMFRQASATHTSAPSRQLVLANYILDLGRISECNELLAELPELEGDADLKRQQLQARVATCSGEFSKAVDLLEELYHADPSNIDVADQFARALLVSGIPAKTSRGIDVAFAKANQNAQQIRMQETLGWAQVMSGDSRKAEQTLLEIAAKHPLSADTAYFTARALASNGKRILAKQLVDRTLEIVGPFDLRQHAERWVQSQFEPSDTATSALDDPPVAAPESDDTAPADKTDDTKTDDTEEAESVAEDSLTVDVAETLSDVTSENSP